MSVIAAQQQGFTDLHGDYGGFLYIYVILNRGTSDCGMLCMAITHSPMRHNDEARRGTSLVKASLLLLRLSANHN